MKKLFSLLLILFAFSATSVYADVNKDLVKAGDSVSVNEKMNGTSFVAGQTVTVDNQIDGILFAAGNTVNVGSLSDYAFVAGANLNVTNATFKDGWLAGSVVNLSNSTVERDLYAAGQTITIDSTIGRNAFLAGQDIVIKAPINGDVYIDGQNITIESGVVIGGKLKYNEDANIVISKDATAPRVEAYKNIDANIKTEKSLGETIVAKVLDALLSFLNLLVVGLLMMLLLPKLFKKIKEIESNKILPDLAWGLLVLIAAPIVAVLLMFTMVGLSTGLIVIGVYVLLAYLATIISSYKLSSLLLENKIKNDYLLLIIGLAAAFIIKLIPFVGGLVSFLLLCLGLGLTVSLYKRK